MPSPMRSLSERTPAGRRLRRACRGWRLPATRPPTRARPDAPSPRCRRSGRSERRTLGKMEEIRGRCEITLDPGVFLGAPDRQAGDEGPDDRRQLRQRCGPRESQREGEAEHHDRRGRARVRRHCSKHHGTTKAPTSVATREPPAAPTVSVTTPGADRSSVTTFTNIVRITRPTRHRPPPAPSTMRASVRVANAQQVAEHAG